MLFFDETYQMWTAAPATLQPSPAGILFTPADPLSVPSRFVVLNEPDHMTAIYPFDISQGFWPF